MECVPHALKKCGEKMSFLAFLWAKPAFSAQTQVETLPVNTTFLIHNFSFRTGVVQEEGDSRSF